MPVKPLHVFSIYDIQTEVWSTPMTAHSVADFQRNLAAQLSRADVNINMMARHPEDFELWSIGMFHDGHLVASERTMVFRLSSIHQPQLDRAAPSSDRQPG